MDSLSSYTPTTAAILHARTVTMAKTPTIHAPPATPPVTAVHSPPSTAYSVLSITTVKLAPTPAEVVRLATTATTALLYARVVRWAVPIATHPLNAVAVSLSLASTTT